MTRKILVIDDEQATLKMFRLILSAYGYETLTAENGETGLKCYEQERPDIILTDIKMPIMDGIEVLTSIKNINPRAEVIVITGHGDMDLTIRALNLDATDFINKPVQRKILSQALERAEERLRISENEENCLNVSESGDKVLMTIRGSVDSNSIYFLGTAFAQAEELGKKGIVLAFDENVSINGAGISTLFELVKKSLDGGHEFYLAGLSDNFRTVFDVVGISGLVRMFDTQEQALAAE